MIHYVNADSKNPIVDAINAMDRSGYHTDTEGRKYYFEAIDEKTINQVYCDGDEEVITWTASHETVATPANKIGVYFYC
jgi:2,3-bisphosphoglycerate-independent phosphoglycerate mutase